MKLRALMAVLGLAVMVTPALAHVEVFYGTLSGLNESPPNSSPGTGWARATIDFDLVTMRVEAQFSGLTGTTTAAHIHARNNSSTANGGVATMLPSFTGFPLGVSSGSMDTTFDMAQASSYNASFITNNGGTVSSAFNALVGKMRSGLTYFNVHTSTFGGGEVRADLQPVPEPATMTAVGLGVIALLRRKRK